MEHLTLYRQFRPSTFDEVIGQEHIVKTLQNQITNGTISHAYLFCGARGTGKTSCAKIFARAVNCVNSQNGSPCGKCEACNSVGINGNLDILEIDAASNNRVDEIRDLREKIKYFPTVGKYKVYIIDEVHMLTDSAANALLKTLEEPPQHAIFVLATTEPSKLPATILSRCMRFDFKLLTVSQLIEHLKNILSKIDIKFEIEALSLIAEAGEGSVRDTLSIAEMCIAYCNGKLTYEKVLNCLGLTNSKTLIKLGVALINRDGEQVIKIVNDIYNNGNNLSVLLKDLSKYFNSLITIKLCNNANSILNLPSEIFSNSKEVVKDVSVETLLSISKILNEGEGVLKYSINEKTNVETTLLSCIYDSFSQILDLEKKLSVLEQKLNGYTLTTRSFEEQPDKKVELVIEKNKSVEISVQKDLQSNKDDTKKSPIVKKAKTDKSAKQILGEMVSFLRSNHNMILHEACREIEGTEIENDNFVIVLKNAMAQKLFEENEKVLIQFLSELGLLPKLKSAEKTGDNKIEILKNKLGRKLIIEGE